MCIDTAKGKVQAVAHRLKVRGREAAAWLVVCGLAFGCAGGVEPGPVRQAGRSSASARAVGLTPQQARLVAAFNRGCALMEQYKYSEAAKAFEQVLSAAPGWTAARFNLALAYFNMHGQAGAEANLRRAKEAFEAVLAAEPGHPAAHFCLGLYHQHLGDNAAALEHFARARRADPNEPYATYKCAETLLALGRSDEGTRLLEKVVATDGGFISAVYRLALQYMRSGRRKEATGLFGRFRELNAAELPGGTFVVQKTYGTAGRYYRVLGADALPLPQPRSPRQRRVVFSPRLRPFGPALSAWKWGGGQVKAPALAAGDFDGDGDLDVVLAAPPAAGGTRVWLNDGAGGFSAGAELAPDGLSVCPGDIDHDGDLDLYLGCAGPDRVLLNDGTGRFSPAKIPSLAGPAAATHCARLLDLDSDGDLDLLAWRLERGDLPVGAPARPAGASLYNCNGDGSYTDVAAKLGLALPGRAVAAVAWDDFDADRDLDLLLFPAGGAPPVAWVNERVGRYRLLDAAATGLPAGGAAGVATGDADADGDADLLLLGDTGPALWENRGGWKFARRGEFCDRFAGLGATGGQFADMDNDGDLDIVLADARRRDGSRGPMLLVNTAPGGRFHPAEEADPGCLLAALRTPGPAACLAADFTGDGRCDILLAGAGSRPQLIVNATPGGHWVELDLRGTRQRGRKARSNRWGLGAQVEVRSGTARQRFLVGGPAGATAVAPARVHVGLGEHPQVEWLRIVWPDAVVQSELNLAAGRVVTVEEVQRKTSSCPYLFAWNGRRFEFVADFGGVGGLGYFLAPGQYAPPDPTEYIRIPRLVPKDGRYVLQCLTVLEEVTYFDEAKLIAVDHPAGTEVYPNEMMAVGLAPPRPELFCYRRRIEPVRATDDSGADVTAALLRLDRRYAGARRVEGHFLGLADEHFVELDFGDRLAGIPAEARIVLFLDGWVEYGYSSTNYAAWQAGQVARAPSIHVLRDGRWVELFKEAGYPAGILHTMTLELTGRLRPGDRKLRISTNMEVYWDRIYLARLLGAASFAAREVPVARAELHPRGYPLEYSPDGHEPLLADYHALQPTAGWKLLAGWYTRFGDVTELLAAADDCFVIIGHGEEMTLEFDARAFGPLPPGRSRTFLLKTDSYCKDMDLYTAWPETVEPLPFHGMSGYPYGPDEHYPDTPKTRAYLRKYNTRRVGPAKLDSAHRAHRDASRNAR